jgi:hypothetical protein
MTDGTRTRGLEVNELAATGWRVEERQDGAVVRQTTYRDWHRVELEMRGFVAKSIELARAGWHIV